MAFSCLISKASIKEDEEFYVIPLLFNELMVLDGIQKYSHQISKSINFKNELYRVALLPVKAKFVNNQITLIEDKVSKHFQEKTNISMQEILNSFIMQDERTHIKYFDLISEKNRLSKQLFPCFIRKKVWGNCIEKIPASDSLWDNIVDCHQNVLTSLGFKKESNTEYAHFLIKNLKITVNEDNQFYLNLNGVSTQIHSVKEIEFILSKDNLTLGNDFIDFSKKTRITKWEIEKAIFRGELRVNHFEDLSVLFNDFYGKDIVNFIEELTNLMEILNILFVSNIMLDKPKYIPNLCDSDKHVNNLHKLLLDI